MKIYAILVAALIVSGCVSALERGNRHYQNNEYDKAAEAWNPLAVQGDPTAQYYIGQLWEYGLGSTPKNKDEASQWYFKAAQQGMPIAMVKLATIQYEAGYKEPAVEWLTVAARWGYQDAKDLLKKLDEPVPRADLLEQHHAEHVRKAEQQRKQEESNESAAAGLFLLGIMGAAALSGGGTSQPMMPPPQSRRSQETNTGAYQPNSSCFSDYACGVGSRCVKKPYSATGVCMKTVNSFGVRTFNSPNPDSIGVNTDSECLFNTDCPVGFMCDTVLRACVEY